MFKFSNRFVFEYSGLLLVSSYIIFHNIFLVLIGLTTSIYIIFLDSSQNFAKRFNIKNIIALINDSFKILKSNKVEEHDENSFDLLEIVEEHGYIPSLKKTDKFI